MVSDTTCDRCGGEMVPGIPGDIYCPNDSCFKADFRESMRALKEMREREEKKTLASLKKKYEGK